MYRIALAGLLALAFVDIAAACPPAPQREIEVNGVKVKEFYCDGGKVLYMHENVYRCFERNPQCLNGFWHENKCRCFPGTHETRPGVCGQICPNCQNGWCYSTSKCVCNDGFQMINGQCFVGYNPYWDQQFYNQFRPGFQIAGQPAHFGHPQQPSSFYQGPHQDPSPQYTGPQQHPPEYTGPQQHPPEYTGPQQHPPPQYLGPQHHPPPQYPGSPPDADSSADPTKLEARRAQY